MFPQSATTQCLFRRLLSGADDLYVAACFCQAFVLMSMVRKFLLLKFSMIALAYARCGILCISTAASGSGGGEGELQPTRSLGLPAEACVARSGSYARCGNTRCGGVCKVRRDLLPAVATPAVVEYCRARCGNTRCGGVLQSPLWQHPLWWSIAEPAVATPAVVEYCRARCGNTRCGGVLHSPLWQHPLWWSIAEPAVATPAVVEYCRARCGNTRCGGVLQSPLWQHPLWWSIAGPAVATPAVARYAGPAAALSFFHARCCMM